MNITHSVLGSYFSVLKERLHNFKRARSRTSRALKERTFVDVVAR